jgi:hypothetical protein
MEICLKIGNHCMYVPMYQLPILKYVLSVCICIVANRYLKKKYVRGIHTAMESKKMMGWGTNQFVAHQNYS